MAAHHSAQILVHISASSTLADDLQSRQQAKSILRYLNRYGDDEGNRRRPFGHQATGSFEAGGFGQVPQHASSAGRTTLEMGIPASASKTSSNELRSEDFRVPDNNPEERWPLHLAAEQEGQMSHQIQEVDINVGPSCQSELVPSSATHVKLRSTSKNLPDENRKDEHYLPQIPAIENGGPTGSWETPPSTIQESSEWGPKLKRNSSQMEMQSCIEDPEITPSSKRQCLDITSLTGRETAMRREPCLQPSVKRKQKQITADTSSFSQSLVASQIREVSPRLGPLAKMHSSLQALCRLGHLDQKIVRFAKGVSSSNPCSYAQRTSLTAMPRVERMSNLHKERKRDARSSMAAPHVGWQDRKLLKPLPETLQQGRHGLNSQIDFECLEREPSTLQSTSLVEQSTPKTQSETEGCRRHLNHLEHDLMPTVPKPAEGQFVTHLTTALRHMAKNVSLQESWRPRKVMRQPRLHERGYWRLQIPSSWSESVRYKFWQRMDKFITQGAAGWSIWLEHKVIENSGSEVSEVKLWCFGECVQAIWTAFYLASKRQVLGAGMAWVDAQGYEVIVME